MPHHFWSLKESGAAAGTLVLVAPQFGQVNPFAAVAQLLHGISCQPLWILLSCQHSEIMGAPILEACIYSPQVSLLCPFMLHDDLFFGSRLGLRYQDVTIWVQIHGSRQMERSVSGRYMYIQV